MVRLAHFSFSETGTRLKVSPHLEHLSVARPDTFGAVEGLPEPAAGTAFVVSGLVGAAVKDRPDVFVPDPCCMEGRGSRFGQNRWKGF